MKYFSVDGEDIVWYDVKKAPFALHGFYNPLSEPFYRRLPQDVAEATSAGVDTLSRESAGGRVRFSTDSPYIAIRAKYRSVGRAPHITLVSSAGFDLYVDGEFGSRYIREFRPPYDIVDTYCSLVHLSDNKLRSYTINFPTHSVVEALEVGIRPGAVLDKPGQYRDLLPVIFYGSSIVHGTASTHPGATYPAIISRDLNIDFINMGFSGNAMGEQVLAEWLSRRPMSVFVCDYDHNAPDLEHLEKTHYSFYQTMRKNAPDVPYIMISRPDYWTGIDQEHILDRRDVIMSSYLKARSNGDKNVYFIDGLSFFASEHQYETVVDCTHPNDFGFVRMAEKIGAVIKHILEKN